MKLRSDTAFDSIVARKIHASESFRVLHQLFFWTVLRLHGVVILSDVPILTLMRIQ